MRGLTSTLILVVVLAGLGAYIYFVDSKRPATTTAAGEQAPQKLFDVDTEKVNEIRVTYQGQSSLLRKSDGGWKMIEPIQVDADPPEAIGLAQNIASLESVRTVDDNPSDVAQFGLDKPQILVEFKAEGGAAGSFKIGNKNPTQSEMYAQKGGDNRVFLVSSFQESNFNRTPFNLRDKKILKFDRDKADALSLVRGPQSIVLARSGSDWTVTAPVPSRSEYATIEGFLTRLSSSNMSKLVEENGGDLAKYGLDKPSMTVTIGTGSAKTVLEIGKTEGGDTFARDASRPLVFTVDTTLKEDLDKNFDEYRKKDVFEFRPFSVSRIRAVLDSPSGAKTYEFEKVPAATPAATESWKVTRVGGTTHTPDQASMDDLLNKLAAIKAASFVDPKTARTGLDKPALVIGVSYEEGKFERVRFGQAGDTAYASRDGEASVAQLDQANLGEALKAFDIAVTPKESAPAPTNTTPATVGAKQ